jgi:hypothetical protein
MIFSFAETGMLGPLETKAIEITMLGKMEMIVEKVFEFRIIEDGSV